MPNLVGDSNVSNVPAVFGDGKDVALGVYGKSNRGWGVQGSSDYSIGVAGISTSGTGVSGASSSGVGVSGSSSQNIGVLGESHESSGVIGRSYYREGVIAESDKSNALIAISRGTNRSAVIINQWGTGEIIIGKDNNNVEVFRVLNNGDVQVRGIALTSDKNVKENFSNVDTLQVLDKLARMPIQLWNYKEDSASVRHIGQNAQDFQAAFGLNGEDDLHISSIDLQGVALAAIQGLNEKIETLKAENAQLHVNLAKLEARISALESK